LYNMYRNQLLLYTLHIKGSRVNIHYICMCLGVKNPYMCTIDSLASVRVSIIELLTR
jgi:hypothetical protein